MVDRTYGQFCAIARSLDVVGDRWTLLKQGSCWLLENLTYNLEQQP